MVRKTLITGATGFVGRNLIEKLLLNNEEIHVIVRNLEQAWRFKDIKKDIYIHNIDLRNELEVSKLGNAIKVNKVYHLATYGGYHYQNDLASIIDTNLISTWKLFKEFSKYDLEMFVNTSSSSEYGEKYVALNEEMCLEPNSMYGASKAASTILCSTFSKINKVPFVTLRLFSPYGYYDSPTRLIPTIITSILLKKDFILHEKTSKRDFIFIEDVIEAYLKTDTLKNNFGEIINVGSGLQYTVEDILLKVSSLIGVSPRFTWENDKERQYEPELWVSNIEKCKNLLSWNPNFNIDEGLSKTIEWYKDNLKLYL
jgi:nucleoside-diphosphate-sugar epimerase